MLDTSVTLADFPPNSLLTAAWLTSIHKWRRPAMKWCRYAQIRPSATRLLNHHGTKPRPLLKAARKRAKDSSEETEVSNIQMMNGISTNISTPLMRCRIDTQPGAGKR